MSNIVLVGGQWGDEGKGKIVDLLSPQFDVVARFAGGPNAGHTVRRGEKKFALHHVPSGILHDKPVCVIGNGTVVDMATLSKEIEILEAEGIKVRSRLRISNRAHVILPFHVEQDRQQEESRGEKKLGTTLRGVGPAYRSKVARTGVRLVDLLDETNLDAALATAVPADDLAANRQSVVTALASIKDMISDTTRYLARRLDEGASILFEGAQGALLDLDHGTYPYVTSSSSTAGGACVGTGVGPTRIDGVMGVFKAYQTRVGAGAFPTEDTGASGERIRELGHEYGTTTGRPRRCGWFDAVLARYAVQVNGMDSAALTLLDVLDEFPEIPVCTGYRYKGDLIRQIPSEPSVLAEVRPEYVQVKGWKTPTTGCRKFDDLPAAAQDYVKFLEDAMECDIDMVSVGAEPEQTVSREVSKLQAWLSDNLWAAMELPRNQDSPELIFREVQTSGYPHEG
jgi:adenylosuccinate synthase